VTEDAYESDLSAMRRSYSDRTLSEADLATGWHEQFTRWFADAANAGLTEPNAMIVASAGGDLRPSARTVLLKAHGPDGLVFYTNYESRKGRELAANPYTCLVFPWFAMQRQVIVTGRVERVQRAQTEAYFATRPRESQLGAWASPQSQPVVNRAELDRLYAETEARFAEGEPIPPPPHWGGLRVRPASVEFWQGRIGRLHDRLRYVEDAGGAWTIERLAP
jgi:pyridoxamine 5'-phosphate oxidase